jgi:hypothetical protein
MNMVVIILVTRRMEHFATKTKKKVTIVAKRSLFLETLMSN